jgi:hypothetical protein
VQTLFNPVTLLVLLLRAFDSSQVQGSAKLGFNLDLLLPLVSTIIGSVNQSWQLGAWTATLHISNGEGRRSSSPAAASCTPCSR